MGDAMGSQPENAIVESQDAALAAAEDDGGWEDWRALTAGAYARFHDTLLASRPAFPGLADYAPVERARATQGTFAWWWGVDGEIRETVNAVNAWGMRLHEWGAWNQVVDAYDTDTDKWEVLTHFVEPIAFYCMLQPSSIADKLSVVAETVLHQANQHVYPSEPDRLDQDELKPGKFLHRSSRRRQLGRLGQRWSQFPAFGAALDAMNGRDYKKLTRDFRNLAAHSFAPRFMMGHVSRAVRSIVPWTEMVPQPDGTVLPTAHPTRKGVQYAMHAFPPLPLDTTYAANLAEYQKASAAMRAFSALVDELCDRMEASNQPA